MAKIFLSFYNGITDPNNEHCLAIFYESFIKELVDIGNELLVFHHKEFFFNIEKVPSLLLKNILEFNPDLIILFNNNFYDVSEYFDCPIVIYEADSILHYGNKKVLLRQPNRYKYFINQEASEKALMSELKVDKKNILYVPCFTSVINEDIPIRTNINFIGTKFFAPGNRAIWNKLQEIGPTQKEKDLLKLFLNEVKKNPFGSENDFFEKYNITHDQIKKIFNTSHAVASLSAGNRVQILSAVADLGLDLYGTKEWGIYTPDDMDLALSYINKTVYSLKHNQDIYNSSKLSININHVQAVTGFSWRVCDIMASNSCIVSEYKENFKKFFPGIPIPTFTNKYEAREQCVKLLNNENMRKDIVAQCQEIINKKYRFINHVPSVEQFLNLKLINNIEGYSEFKHIKISPEIKNHNLSWRLQRRMRAMIYSTALCVSLVPGFNIFLKKRRKNILNKIGKLI